jgi:hypothetical protein
MRELTYFQLSVVIVVKRGKMPFRYLYILQIKLGEKCTSSHKAKHKIRREILLILVHTMQEQETRYLWSFLDQTRTVSQTSSQTC